METVPEHLSDGVDNGISKNTKFSTLKTKANNLDEKSLDATTYIHIDQYKTDKQNLIRKYQIQVV